MKVNEEVDALVTMGFDPVRFLAVPKVFAAILVVPLLTFFSDLFAILGGMTVGLLGLGLTFTHMPQQTSWALEVFDIGAGVVKSVVFAILIAGIGCREAFRHGGGGSGGQRDHLGGGLGSFSDHTWLTRPLRLVLNYVR